jgi:nucleoside-diphosphate-sugar epimerase
LKRIIITGASGFVGKAFAKKMLEAGILVYAVVRNTEKISDLQKFKNLVVIQAELSDYKNLTSKINERKFDVFYHFAWEGVAGDSFKNYDLQLRNSVYACDAIMAAIDLECKKFVFAGTINEFEVQKYLRVDYNISPRFTCIYSTSKMAAGMICKTLANNYGIEYNAGLLAMGYGEGKIQNVLPNVVIRSLINNSPIKLIEGNNLYDLVYIDDIVEALYLIGVKGVNQKNYYVGHQKQKTFKEVITDIRDILNPEYELSFGEYKDNLDMDYSLIDTNSLHEDTGFECKADFRDSILKTAAWIKESKLV